MLNRDEKGELALAHQLEADILSRINHPQIPGFIEAFTLNGVYYIVQEFVEGLPLSYYIYKGCRFNEDEVKRILFQLLSILDYLHSPPQKENAIVHRDLRLSNILLNSGKIFLLDFGFARYLDPAQFSYVRDPLASNKSDRSERRRCFNKSALPRVPGAATYRLLRREISTSSDLFGTGVVGLDLFTNLVEDPQLFKKPWQSVLPLSGSFTCFLEKLLRKTDRFNSAAEAMQHLEQS